MFKKLLNFKSRKIIQYFLIVCILLIQLLIAGFFYNEFINRKNLTFIEKQLNEVHSLENLTDNSRRELLNAQDDLQKYIMSEDNKYLESYFKSLNKLGENLDSIGNYQYKFPRLKNVLTSQKKDSLEIKKLKVLIDSTYQFSTKSNFKVNNELPKLKKYDLDYNLDKFNVETKTYSDTVKKKGLFGRLGDAISGKENVRKESTVITLKQGKKTDISAIKKEMDSIINQVDNHYSGEIKKIKVNVTKNQNNNGKFYKIFSNLLDTSFI